MHSNTAVWDLDGGGMALLPPGTASPPGPTHTYADRCGRSALGYCTVSLTIQDTYRSDTLVKSRYIHVTDVIHNVHVPLVLKQSPAGTLEIEVIGGKHG
jgi:PKD repeat protein